MRTVTEGTVTWNGHHTWYRRVHGGDRTPLLLLHGGPGSTHNYFELLDELADTGRDIISYDQLGCGNSYLDGHPELWKPETWMEELKEVIRQLDLKEVHLLGQSWGGMLELLYALNETQTGIRTMILSSTLPSSRLWSREQHRMILQMPQAEQEAILRAEKTNTWDDPAYLKANEHFMTLHCAGPYTEEAPECLRRPKKSGTEAYLYGWGPNEYNPTGTLKDYDVTDRLRELNMPCLICSGTDDLCTPYIAKTMYDRIPHAQWHLFEYARHMCFADSHEEYINVLTKWLEEH
jgi:proline iminopeptidase